VRLAHVPWEEPAPATEDDLRARLTAEGFSAFRWTDAPGAHYEPHSHEADESLWVLAGEMTFEVDGRKYRLGPGDRLQLPSGTLHAATAGPEGATYLIGEREGLRPNRSQA
jgi:quercetin dioxygenase-like cupin family protein